ncbi:hypothetical protein TruAng_009329 [Truncatella angustata]|nr:hypothetical protein TruAng_009329 [Truncatella angustata]
MAEIVVAAYPKGANMNFDYYLKNHVPMVFGFWQPYAKSWRAEKLAPEADSPYDFMIFIEFEHAGDFGKACAALSADKSQRIDDDLKNYSQKSPVFWTQERIGFGSA